MVKSKPQILFLLSIPIFNSDICLSLTENEGGILLFILIGPYAHEYSDSILFNLH